jgi:hypothetical protein
MTYIYKRQFHSDAYFIALVLLAMSIPTSRFTMSVFQFTLLGLWLWSGFSFEVAYRYFRKAKPLRAIWCFLGYMVTLTRSNLISKFTMFFQNKVAMVLVSLFLLHLLGLIHTSDYQYALKDIRTKLPLLLLPIVLSTMERISLNRMKILLVLYVLTVFTGTVFGFLEYLKQEFTDIRQISVFINPVRFSLNIVFAVFILIWFVFYDQIVKWQWRIAAAGIAAWMMGFLFLMESAIGMLSLFLITLGLLLIRMFLLTSFKVRIITAALVLILPMVGYFYLNKVIRELTTPPPIDYAALDTHSATGQPYIHDTVHFGIEDGKYVGLYLSLDELEKAWNERSDLAFNGKDYANQDLMYTLIRFMTSLDLRKDAEGLSKMTDKEIRMVENGIANINYVTSPSLRTRVSKILLGYTLYTSLNDPNGSSVMQRVEYLKASFYIIRQHFWTGVGTGDLPDIFRKTYEEIDSPLQLQWRWRSHNQYLSIFIAFGVFGFTWFLFVLFYIYIKAGMYRNFFYSVFFAIFLLSMLTEDTIESQDGITLFAFFTCFFLFAVKSFNEDEPERKSIS